MYVCMYVCLYVCMYYLIRFIALMLFFIINNAGRHFSRILGFRYLHVFYFVFCVVLCVFVLCKQ